MNLTLRKKGFKRLHGHGCKVSCLFSTRVYIQRHITQLHQTKAEDFSVRCKAGDQKDKSMNLLIWSHNNQSLSLFFFLLFSLFSYTCSFHIINVLLLPLLILWDYHKEPSFCLRKQVCICWKWYLAVKENPWAPNEWQIREEMVVK